MSSLWLRAAAAAMFGSVLTAPAFAEERPVTGEVVGGIKAPAMLSRCLISFGGGGYWHGLSFNVLNRTAHRLLSLDARLRFYDSENALIGSTTIPDSFTSPLFSGDTTLFVQPSIIAVKLTEPASAVTRMTCDVADAAFAGNLHWEAPATWPERLRPIPAESGAVPSTTSSPVASASTIALTSAVPAVPAAPPIALAVTNAWDDALAGATVVHAAVALTGGAVTTRVHPANFILTMTLANGNKKPYPALAQAAPTYQKLNPMGSTFTIANEVDPTVDLGRLGSVTVPAHASVTVTVSFLVVDPLANPNDNRNVTVH